MAHLQDLSTIIYLILHDHVQTFLYAFVSCLLSNIRWVVGENGQNSCLLKLISNKCRSLLSV